MKSDFTFNRDESGFLLFNEKSLKYMRSKIPFLRKMFMINTFIAHQNSLSTFIRKQESRLTLEVGLYPLRLKWP